MYFPLSTASFYVRPAGSAKLKLWSDSSIDVMTWEATTGNVGIGTTAPEGKLDIRLAGTANETGDWATDFGSAGSIVLANANNSVTNNKVGIFGGNNGGNLVSGIGFARESGANWGTQLRFYTHSVSTSNIDELIERVRINSAGYATFYAGHGDLAENYNISGTALRGNLISIDNTTAKTAITSSPTESSLLGVVSTKPGAVMDVDGGFQVGYDTKPTYTNEKVPVALTGAVPTLVTSQNGTINIGDAIGLSNNPGFGAKMTTAGNIVGKALETLDASSTCQSASSTESITWPEDDGKNTLKPCFSLPDGTIVGKIMVAVNVSWYDSGTNISDLLEIVKKQQAEIEQMKTQLTSLERKNK
jgi:hypothetical protein